MRKIKSIAVLQEDKIFGEKIPFGTDSDKVDVSSVLEQAFQNKEIELEDKTIDGAFVKLLEDAEVTQGEVVKALGYTPPKDDTQGINLLLGTKNFTNWYKNYNFTDDNKYDASKINGEIITIDISGEAYSNVKIPLSELQHKKMTVSCYLDGDTDIDSAKLSLVFNLHKKGVADRFANKEVSITLSKLDADYAVGKATFDVDETISNTEVDSTEECTFGFKNRGSAEIKMKYSKLEYGIVENPVWSPAPEDLLLKGEVDGRNLFVMGDSEPGTMNGFDGKVVVGYFADRTCDYISVHEGEQISIRSIGTAPINIDRTYYIMAVWFDSGKNHISYVDHYQKQSALTEPTHYDESFTITAPANAAYLRVSARFYDDGKIKVERGSIATDWTPAPEDLAISVKDNHILVIGL